MNKLSNILGKPVISLYNGQVEGTILNAVFDKKLKKIKYLNILNENNVDDTINENRMLDTKNIYCVGQDAIIIKNNSYLENISTLEPKIEHINPTNSLVYTTLGKYLGKIVDISFDDKFYVIECNLNNGTAFNVDTLAILGNGITIIQDDNKKIDISKLNIKKPSIRKTNEVVKILRIDNAPTLNLVESNETTPPTLPTKITTSVDFLLGRVITENLYTQSKELIAKKGNTISLKTIENAKKFGKIKDLSIFSA